MVLYPLIRTRDGRRQGEFPVGTLEWDGERVQVHCRDRALGTRLKEFFAEPILIRVPQGTVETVIGHSWVRLEPGSEDHFLEGVRRLRRLDLTATLEG